MEQVLQIVSERPLYYYRRVARPDRHRAELVAATGQLLRRRGYSGTSVSDFLDAAGAANGSMYHHFPGGKEELASAAIRAAGENVEAALLSAFEATDESGAALFGNAGTIVGSSLESSNTDIADEFTKLIVTQQAYSANTKVITTTNSMVQDLLNVMR